ncbi:MAG: hypothetical protein JW795_09325, partial [Chitinivibrionales bacterium]|nr:hypothetical protein [Chitinivibrionales bacterium]
METISLRATLISFYFFISGVIAVRAAPSLTTIPDTSEIVIIKKIAIEGNVTTTAETILRYCQFDTGSVYDTGLITAATKRLEQSNLFTWIKIYPVATTNGMVLLMSVREAAYIAISDIGAEPFTRKFGRNSTWYRARLGLTHNNFRGRAERFSVYSSIWDSRNLSVVWNKPFITTPYFMSFSAG